MTKRALVPVVAVTLVVVGGFVVIGTFATASPSDENMRTTGETTSGSIETPVSADVLWDETLDAVECLRDDGIEVFGPVPVTSGIGIMYSLVSTDEAREAEDRCTVDLEPLTQRFFFANAPREGPDGEQTPPTAEVERLGAIADQLESCLTDAGVPLDRSDAGVDPDAPLTRAAQDHPSAFDECARQV